MCCVAKPVAGASAAEGNAPEGGTGQHEAGVAAQSSMVGESDVGAKVNAEEEGRLPGGAPVAGEPATGDDDGGLSCTASDAGMEVEGGAPRGDFWVGGDGASDADSDPSACASQDYLLASESESSRSGARSEEESSQEEESSGERRPEECSREAAGEGNVAEEEDIPNEVVVVCGAPARPGMGDVHAASD